MRTKFALIWGVCLHCSLLGMDGAGACLLWSAFEGLLYLRGGLRFSLFLQLRCSRLAGFL